MIQVQVPFDVLPDEITRKRTLGAAIDLCLELGGKEPKKAQLDLKVDKGQFSRWSSGEEGIKWPKLEALQQYCGNSAPVLWMFHQAGFDLESVRRLETELERENRLLREENAALRRAFKSTP